MNHPSKPSLGVKKEKAHEKGPFFREAYVDSGSFEDSKLKIR